MVPSLLSRGLLRLRRKIGSCYTSGLHTCGFCITSAGEFSYPTSWDLITLVKSPRPQRPSSQPKDSCRNLGCPPRWRALYINFLVGGPGDINVAVSKQDFTQINFTFLVKVYKVLFKNVFKAFNLLKNMKQKFSYLAMASICSP
jgi:hypothetical protein